LILWRKHAHAFLAALWYAHCKEDVPTTNETKQNKRRAAYHLFATKKEATPLDIIPMLGRKGRAMALRSFILLMCVLVGTTLTVTGPASALPTPPSVKIVGAGPEIDKISTNGGSQWERVYLGPYSLQVPMGAVATPWMCFDAVPNVSINQFWSVEITTDPIRAASRWFPNSDPALGLQKIHMISYLANQWDGKSSLQLGGINEAIWEISADYALNVGTSLNLSSGSFRVSNDNIQYKNYAGGILAQAFDHRNNDFGQSYFLIPIDYFDNVIRSIQPFVSPDHDHTSPTPEPGTLLLLGSGLAGLVGVGWKRRQS
jgi:hypothetical protein